MRDMESKLENYKSNKSVIVDRQSKTPIKNFLQSNRSNDRLSVNNNSTCLNPSKMLEKS